MKRWWPWLVVVALGLSVMFLAEERNRALLLEPRGHIESGEKFGIRVGMTAARGESIATSQGLHLRELAPQPVDVCGTRTSNPGEEMQAFRDDSLRRGYVCTFIRNGQVVAVAWTFCPLCP